LNSIFFSIVSQDDDTVGAPNVDEALYAGVSWDLGTWLGAEFAVILGGGIVYGIGQELAGWPER
jgi:hypothetical protein